MYVNSLAVKITNRELYCMKSTIADRAMRATFPGLLAITLAGGCANQPRREIGAIDFQTEVNVLLASVAAFGATIQSFKDNSVEACTPLPKPKQEIPPLVNSADLEIGVAVLGAYNNSYSSGIPAPMFSFIGKCRPRQ
jgi:hypothetical protein